MAGLASFYLKYCTENRDLTIHGRQFSFVVPKKIDPFIDFENVVRGFPLWAKIWESSWVLAEHLAKTPPFQIYLKPKGRIILASGVRQSVLDILPRMQRFFHVKINKYSIRCEDIRMPAVLCHMSPRE